jgi:GGDEF domain-containing protein
MELVNLDLADLAAEAGAGDLLVLRRVDGARFANLGGSGRGEAWAGNVEVDVEDEPVAMAALAAGDVQLVHGDAPQRVLGPYWSLRAAVVPVDRDALVVLGGLSDPRPEPSRLRDVAFRAALQVDRVAPGKRVADDLEVVHAVRDVMGVEATGVKRTMLRVADLTAAALDADLVVVWLRAGGEVAVGGRAQLPAEHVDVALAMTELAEHGAEVVQDATSAPLPHPLDGVPAASWSLVPLADLGAILVVHALHRPRGFTGWCRDLGNRLGEAASCVLHAAVVRERLELALRALTDRARRDELTGAANRSAWDEALATAGSPATTLVVTLTFPHAGEASARHLRDEVLRAGATALREALRDGDVVARLGGTSFGVLLHGIGADRAPDVVERLRASLAAAPPVHGTPLEARISGASTPGEPSAAAAAAVAEARAACAGRP